MRAAVVVGCFLAVLVVATASADIDARHFDHYASTGFSLSGKHWAVGCKGCHETTDANGERIYTGLGKHDDCRGCHTHEKVHDGKWTSAQCVSCHVIPGPPPPAGAGRIAEVYHGPKSEFPLASGHKNVPCADCHTGHDDKGKISFAALDPQCGPTCHTDDGSHAGSLGAKCDACHVGGRWDALKFEHTRYPLVGFHRDAKCSECHADKRFTAATACAGCHQDTHAGKLGRACENCHQPNGDLTFDHQKKARFKVDGKHLTVACARCHTQTDFTRAKTECEDCHTDPHWGRKGHACAACHSTKTFARRQ